MVTMDDISNAIILLVRVGAVARFVYCLVRLTAAEEQAAQYKKRARNTVIFYIIAESIWLVELGFCTTIPDRRCKWTKI